MRTHVHMPSHQRPPTNLHTRITPARAACHSHALAHPRTALIIRLPCGVPIRTSHRLLLRQLAPLAWRASARLGLRQRTRAYALSTDRLTDRPVPAHAATLSSLATHTHACTRERAQTRTHARARTGAHARACTLARVRTHARTPCVHARTGAHARSHARTGVHARTGSHARGVVAHPVHPCRQQVGPRAEPRGADRAWLGVRGEVRPGRDSLGYTHTAASCWHIPHRPSPE
jgi:hypothetical protein